MTAWTWGVFFFGVSLIIYSTQSLPPKVHRLYTRLFWNRYYVYMKRTLFYFVLRSSVKSFIIHWIAFGITFHIYMRIRISNICTCTLWRGCIVAHQNVCLAIWNLFSIYNGSGVIMLFLKGTKRWEYIQTDRWKIFEIVYGKPISYCFMYIVAFPTHLTLLYCSGFAQVMKILRYGWYKYLNRFTYPNVIIYIRLSNVIV